jgi:hypothetical protein
LRQWDDIKSDDWRNLGRRDIVVIAERRGGESRLPNVHYQANIKSAKDIGLEYLGFYRWSRAGGFQEDMKHQEGGDADLALESAAYIQVQVSRAEAVICHISIQTKTFVLLFKWESRRLSFGIWEQIGDPSDWLRTMEAIVSKNQPAPFPHSANLSQEYIVRMSAMPMPMPTEVRSAIHRRRRIFGRQRTVLIKSLSVQLLVETSQHDTYYIPQVIYSKKYKNNSRKERV